MIDQLDINGNTMVETAVLTLQMFEPEEGYHLAFSGGKDSVVIKALADMAGVKYDAHYNITSVDPPELVAFVKTFSDVRMDKPRYKKGPMEGKQVTMWNLIPQKRMPPTRVARYCCQYLKEEAGEDRFTITGVRRAESAKRSKRGRIEAWKTKSGNATVTVDPVIDPDNQTPELFYICKTYSKKVLNPIIDWTDEDVWEFIHRYNVRYCKLYDEGLNRLGCIGCPMSGGKRQMEEFNRYPKIRQAYIRAFDKMLKEREKVGLPNDNWKNGEDVMRWWLGEEVDEEDGTFSY